MIATKHLFLGLEIYFVFALVFAFMFLTKVSFALFLFIHQLLQADGCKSERLMCGVEKYDKHIQQYSTTPVALVNTKMIRKPREVSPSVAIHAFHPLRN